MEIEQIKLNGDERLIDALKSRGYKDIPSNVILDKTLTGIGATYAELHSYRNSIIIDPMFQLLWVKLQRIVIGWLFTAIRQWHK